MEITTAAIDLITVLESPLNIKKKGRKKIRILQRRQYYGIFIGPDIFSLCFSRPIFLIGEMVIHVI